MNFIKQMFSGKNGKISSMRVNATIWITGVLFCVIWVVIRTNAFPAIPDSISLSIPAVLFAKGFQSSKETQDIQNPINDAPKAP